MIQNLIESMLLGFICLLILSLLFMWGCFLGWLIYISPWWILLIVGAYLIGECLK